MAAQPEVSPRATPPWRQKLTAFWRWWTDELSQVLPERFAALRGAGRVPQLAIEGEHLVLVEPRPASGADAPRIPLDELDTARRRAAVQAMLQRAGETRSRARLALGRHEALVRRVTMPAATEENLPQVLAFEMDRLTPFRADEVYFDHRVIARDPAAGTIGVLLAVARRGLVDGSLEKLHRLGLSVQGVTVRDEALPGGAPLDLLPPEQRGERETPAERTAKVALGALVALLLFAVLVLPLWQKRQQVIALQPIEGRAQAEAQAANALAQELEQHVADYNFLLARKHGNPPALAYLEEVSRLLPDNTWVNQLELKTSGKSREVQISGETSSASRLIEVLEQSRLLRNAAPRGTVTRGSVPGTERFMIAAEAQGRPPPEPMRLSDLETPGAAPARPPSRPPTGTQAATPAKVEPQPPKAPAKADAADSKSPPPAAPAARK